jgi:peptidoglycan-associated lipoprotein
MRYFLSLFFLAFFLVSLAFKPGRPLKAAEQKFRQGYYYEAIQLYKKGLDAEKNPSVKAHALYLLGRCYYSLYDYKQAEAAFAKAIKAGCKEPEAHLYLAQCKKSNMKLDEAAHAFSEYVRVTGIRDTVFLASCERAKWWHDHPAGVVQNLAQINSKDWEYSPALGDTGDLLFVSTRLFDLQHERVDPVTGHWAGKILFSAEDRNGKWKNPVPFPRGFSSGGFITGMSYDAAGNKLYYSQRPMSKKIIPENRIFGCSVQDRTGDCGKEIPVLNGGNYNALTPAPANGAEIIFAADLPGGFGGYDLWRISYDTLQKNWSAPVNFGASVNTASNEISPYLLNNSVLYFSSDRLSGLGGYDIYRKEISGTITNPGFPINSSMDETGIVFLPGNTKGYLVSNREGTKGGFDIWQFALGKQ